MRMLEKTSLKNKLVGIIVITSMATMIVAMGLLAVLDFRAFRSSMLEELNTLAEVVGSNSTAALMFSDQEAGARILSAFGQKEGVMEAVLYTKQGEIFSIYQRDKSKKELTFPRLEEDRHYHAGGSLHIFRPIMLDNERIGTIYLCSDLEVLHALFRRYLGTICGILFGSLILALILASRLQAFISRPILSLVTLAKQVGGQGNYALRAKETGKDELGQLAYEFNQMLAQIQKRDLELEKANLKLKREMKDREDAQAQLLQTGKMAAVGTLVAGLSHELNNPIGIVMGYAQTLIDEVSDESPLRPMVMAIERQARRTGQLVKALLDFSRRSTGERKACSVHEIFKHVQELSQGQVARHDVKLQVVLSQNGIPNVNVCASEIESVLLNLISNAVHATSRGGSIKLGFEKRDQNGRPGVGISITDSGAGISPEALPRIFDPFFTTKEVGKGTGLGLSLAHQIVEAHQGTITVESEVGKGSTFYIWLPAADPNAEHFRKEQGS